MPETVSPDALTCRLTTAIGETDSVTLRVAATGDGGTEVERVVHSGDDELSATTTLSRPVTLDCSQVVVTRLSQAAGGIKLVRPVLRPCAEDAAVDAEATFHRDGEAFTREGRQGPPAAPASAPSYTWRRLQGGGFVAGTLVPAIGGLVERVAMARQRHSVDATVTATPDELRLAFDRLAQPEQHYDCRVENGAVCVWLLGERETEDGTDRTEHSVRFVPPFPVTAAGGSVTAGEDGIVVTVPRVGQAERRDGSLDVESVKNVEPENAVADAD
ncbi:hypothetical protein [Haloarchaeobius sp. HME9146]|uniref:hypothetical protein n=1 Tax=Haloarchaeobius sp. HME9146 TaxID=2978732 RepID=UPI0021C04F4B|nr:hypothetical protein [Haloarchaeobius sp. HME9146]MCT9097123.1 hypothetical protein [Haloarchaeobius sp. HME9146]